MFLIITWEFTAHYLQAAYLLNTTIDALKTGDETALKRRKLKLRIIEISVYVLLLVIFTVLTTYRSWNYWLLSEMILLLGACSSMTLVTLLSMWHINKNSKALDCMGI